MTAPARLQLSAGDVYAVEVDGRPHIVLKPAMEAIGIDYDNQRQKLDGKSWATKVLSTVVAADGKSRQMLCVDTRTFLMLLATIDENRVAEHARPTLIAYQSEVADAVESHFADRRQVAIPSHSEALRGWAAEIEAREIDRQRIAELEPKAEVADRLLDADGDLSVADAAKALTRAGVKTGAGRLFGDLERRGWIFRARGDGRWRVTQRAIDQGLMSVLPASHYHPKTGVLVLDPPQPRVTPKGLQRLLSEYGALVPA